VHAVDVCDLIWNFRLGAKLHVVDGMGGGVTACAVGAVGAVGDFGGFKSH
jgi:hypothetical protein